MATQTWTDSIKVHLELLNQIAARLPANEKLEPAELNKILELHGQFLNTFIMQMELQGFKLGKPNQQ